MVSQVIDKRIGVALSGGGFRAAVFHLGVLKYLAENNLLQNIKFISTVSGASLLPALIFSISSMRWPTDPEFLSHTLPAIRTQLTGRCLQSTLVMFKIIFFWRKNNGAQSLADAISFLFNIKGTLKNLPDAPRWLINATCYQTGKNWRFEKKRMGDYLTNYVLEPDFEISKAISASSGYPGLVGALELKTDQFEWVKYISPGQQDTQIIGPNHTKYHLWDGALYENLGLEPLMKFDTGYREGIDAIIISDACLARPFFLSRTAFSVFKRLIDIPMIQVQSLRARMVWNLFKKDRLPGAYIKIGMNKNKIIKDYEIEDNNSIENEFLTDKEIETISAYPTDFKKLSKENFDLLVRHGYETAQISLLRI